MPKVAKVVDTEVPEENTAERIHQFSTGVRFTFKRIGTMLMYDAQAAIVDPDPPLMYVPGPGGKQRAVENYDQPQWKAILDRHAQERNFAVINAIIINGVRLVDPIPPDEEWYDDLSITLDLSGYMRNGELTESSRRFLYVKYVAVASPDDFSLLLRLANASDEDIQESVETF